MSRIKILTVCLGNICRSPLAEGVLRSKLDTGHFEVDSAGTANYHVGEAPDPRAIAVGRKNGVDISNLRGRQFTAKDFSSFDYIFVMDKSNYQNVLRLAKNDRERSKVHFLLDTLSGMAAKELPDPYYGDEKAFDDTYTMVDAACELIAKKLQKQIDN